MKKEVKSEFLKLYEDLKKTKDSKAFSLLVDALYVFYRDIWVKCSEDFADLQFPVYKKVEKKRNEKKVDDFLNKILIGLKSVNNRNDYLARDKFKNTFFDYFNNSNFFKDPISCNYPYDFISSTNDFIKKTQKFDPTVTSADIFQALRNVWTMNLLQTIFAMDIKLTYPIFSYSMLYPYTDNLLDSTHASYLEKKERSNRLMDRLKGNKLIPHDFYEEKVFRLVEIIEECYPRRYYYCLYQSLQAINSSQVDSLKQFDKKNNRTMEEIIKISFKKGGLSVLTDAYLIKGTLSLDEIIGAFGLGIALQLIDDLQDVKQDKRSGNSTIFTFSQSDHSLMDATVKLLNFIKCIIDLLPTEKSPYKEKIEKVLSINCYLLIFFSISRLSTGYTRSFSDKIAVYSPFSPTYMKNFNSKLNSKWSSIKKLKNISAAKIFAILLEDGSSKVCSL